MSLALPKRLPTNRSAVSRAWRWLRGLWLRLRIHWTQQYLADCARDGITKSLAIDEFNSQLQALRVELALLEHGR